MSAEPGAGGLILLPYLDGERTPDLPSATGTLGGLTRFNATPANLARSAVEGMLCGLADGMDALRVQGLTTRRVLLIGGAARSLAVQEIAPSIFGASVTVPAPLEYVAVGAARQAAWALRANAGSPDLPDWASDTSTIRSLDDLAAGERVRAAYGEFGETVYPATGGTSGPT
jgi:xylulokinase